MTAILQARKLLFLFVPVIAIALLLTSFASQARTDDQKLDPELRRAYRARSARKVGVVIRLSEDSDDSVRGLEAAGIRLRGRIGDLAAAEVATDDLPRLASIGSVRYVHQSRPRTLLGERGARRSLPSLGNDAANSAIKAPDARSAFNVTGRGVVVGIVDSGIDIRHGDFLNAEGKTRIKALWDMSDGSGSGPGGVGRVYQEAEINTLLPAAASTGQCDFNGHGTQVAGTAAGNGQGTGGALPAGTFSGIAPEADLIIVKATRSTNEQASFYDDDIIAGLSFIRDQAAILNEPFVINLSFGGHFSSHDGNDPLEIAIDNLIASGNGRQVVIAAGNDGATGIHAGGMLAENDDVAIPFSATSKAVGILALYHGSDAVTARIIKPNGTIVGPAPLYRLITSDSDVELENAVGETPASPKAVLVTFKHRPPGTWTLVLSGTRIVNGRYDLWVQDGGETRLDSSVVDDFYTVASPATSRRAISVGNFVSKTLYLDQNGVLQARHTQGAVGQLAKSSSLGPSRDGRLTPLIIAPGSFVASTRSSDFKLDSVTGNSVSADLLTNDGGRHVVSYGSSLSAAAVTGTVALMLQANRNLTSDQVRRIVAQTATGDGLTGEAVGPQTGYGKINALAAVQAALDAGVTPGFVSVSAASYNPETVAAPAAIMAGFGANLAGTAAAAASLPLPLTLGGISVKLTDSSGTAMLAPLFYVSPAQVNYQVPEGVSPGMAKVEIVRQDQSIAARGAIGIRKTWPGIFSASADGQGIAAGEVLRIAANGSRSYQSLANPISLTFNGDTVYLQLYGTGLRGRSNQGDVSITLGGTSLPVDYVGPQGWFVGLDQINVQLPLSLAGRGRTLDLVVYVDGVPANIVQCRIG